MDNKQNGLHMMNQGHTYKSQKNYQLAINCYTEAKSYFHAAGDMAGVKRANDAINATMKLI